MTAPLEPAEPPEPPELPQLPELPGPQLTLHVLGRRCPAPIIELARHIGEVAPGQVVEVLADDAAARLDVPAWCGLRGHTYLGERPNPTGGSGYLVRRER